MKIAWFRPKLDCSPLLDETAQVIERLQHQHEIHSFDLHRAHEFVWLHAKQPYDVCIYELEDTLDASFIWPYLLRFPGLTLLRSATLTTSRRETLRRERRLEALHHETVFDTETSGLMLRAVLMASKLVAVSSPGLADSLNANDPNVRTRYLPLGLKLLNPITSPKQHDATSITFGCLAPSSRQYEVMKTAAKHSAAAGFPVTTLINKQTPEAVLAQTNVVLALHPTPNGRPPTDAVAAMAASKTLVVLDTIETADWPALDPHTWKTRDILGTKTPICISLDVRDEVHSLALVMRRLCKDPRLGKNLAQAAQQWWKKCFTLDTSIKTLETLLEETRTKPPPVKPEDWPTHLTSDGTEHAKSILAELGCSIDLFEQSPSP